MSLLCQLPYNFKYDDQMIDYLYDYKDIIDSVYVGFSKGDSSVSNNHRTIEQHIRKLDSIKKLLEIKVVYLINSVIPKDLDDVDTEMFQSGVVDCVNTSRDDVFIRVEEFSKENNISFSYEVSRLYNYLSDNKDLLKNKAERILFGFKHELEDFCAEKDHYLNLKIGYIANEECFPFCDKIVEHSKNIILRNFNEESFDFECPYTEYKKTNTAEEIFELHNRKDIELLKLCDRTKGDEELIDIFSRWFPIVETINSCDNEQTA